MKAPYRTKEITLHICHSDHTIQCTATSNAPTLHARWKRKNRIARFKHTIARQHHIIKALKQENAQLWQDLYNLATAPKR